MVYPEERSMCTKRILLPTIHVCEEIYTYEYIFFIKLLFYWFKDNIYLFNYYFLSFCLFFHIYYNVYDLETPNIE